MHVVAEEHLFVVHLVELHKILWVLLALHDLGDLMVLSIIYMLMTSKFMYLQAGSPSELQSNISSCLPAISTSISLSDDAFRQCFPSCFPDLSLQPSSTQNLPSHLMATPSFQLLCQNVRSHPCHFFLSHPTSDPLGNTVHSAFKIYPQPDHFSTPSL